MGLTLKQWCRERKLFLGKFCRELWNWNFEVGAIAPTCGAVRRAIFRHFPHGVEHVVNVGAGTGVFERDLNAVYNQRRFHKLHRWDALEPYSPFADFFRATVHDSRVKFHEQYSWHLPGILGKHLPDVLLYTVPKLNGEDETELTQTMFSCVRPGGLCIRAIFRDVRPEMSQATGIPLEEIDCIPAVGQLLPPKAYQVQIMRKGVINGIPLTTKDRLMVGSLVTEIQQGHQPRETHAPSRS